MEEALEGALMCLHQHLVRVDMVHLGIDLGQVEGRVFRVDESLKKSSTSCLPQNTPIVHMGLIAAFHTHGSCGRNLQATRCVLGGKS